MPAPRILVVEDESIVALHLRRQLLKLGYEVPDAVATGDHALREIAASRPDLVLMDINLKGQLDGIATASRIPAAYRTPVIYLTAYSEETTLARASTTNPYGYLLKPFSEREVHAMIQMTLARCHAEYVSRIALESRRQAEKMTALGQLAVGVAREFNDLLSVIYGQLEALGQHAIEHPALTEPIEEAFGAAIEKEKLVRRLLAFGGSQTLTPASTCVAGLVLKMCGELDQLSELPIEIETSFPDDLWCPYVDARRLSRALLEVAMNARDAMPDGGSLKIEAKNVVLERNDPHAACAMTPGRYVLLTMADTGAGMAQSVIDRAFEPLFTTRTAAGGLGLSLVFGFIRQSGGHISIDSEPGLGATVQLYLPVTPDTTEAVSSDEPLLLPSTLSSAAMAGSAAEHRPSENSPTGATWRQHDVAGPIQGSAAGDQAEHGLAVAWRKAENALFASFESGSDGVRYRLTVEALPRRNGWDWVVWRPGDKEETARHGRASSVSAAMAAAEAAAKRWDMLAAGTDDLAPSQRARND